MSFISSSSEPVYKIIFPDNSEIVSSDKIFLALKTVEYGDTRTTWIVEYEGRFSIEVAWHNPNYIKSIIFKRLD